MNKSASIRLFLMAVTVAAISLSSIVALAQTNVNPTTNSTSLSNSLLSPNGSITITDVQYSGASSAVGTFTDGPFGMREGIAISSGHVSEMPFVSPQGHPSTGLGQSGHPLCNQLTPSASANDAAVLTLTFDVEYGIDGIQFDYIVGSQEYPNFVGGSFNDSFGVFLNGQNVALDSNGNDITINGPFFSGGTVVEYPHTQSNFNGSTPRLISLAEIQEGSTDNQLQIVVCDAGDSIYDTGAFLSALEACFGDCSGTSVCGDGVVDPGEECDVTAVNPAYAACPVGYVGHRKCNNDPNLAGGDGSCTVSDSLDGCMEVNPCVDPSFNTCDFNATCTSGGSNNYECECNEGWEGDGENCESVDLCEEPSLNSCDEENATCTYLGPGSYECECNENWAGDGVTCYPFNVCVDPDLHSCDEMATCTGFEGGLYECECFDGWVGDGTTCEQFTVCMDSSMNSCDENAHCEAEPGSEDYECECIAGWAGDGEDCEEYPACADSSLNDCDENAMCTGSSDGSYECECGEGWTGDGTECVEIDACEDSSLNSCDPLAICTSTGPGTYECECEEGWAGDGTECEEIDACEDSSMNSCDDHANCTSTGPGTYDCQCEMGWIGDGYECEKFTACIDSSMNSCDPMAICTATNLEDYECECMEGYFGDGTECEEYAICADSSLNSCDENATCTGTSHDTYDCECEPGFIGDGMSCTVITTINEPTDDSIINDPNPVIDGTGEPGATITVEINGEEVGTTEVDEDGNWEFEVEDELDDGEVVIVAGDGDSEAEVIITVDTVPPSIELHHPQDGEVFEESPDVISGEADPGSSVEVYIDGEFVGRAKADSNGEWSLEFDGDLEDGIYEVVAVATDEAGNQAEDIADLIIDSTADVVILGPDDGTVVTTDTPLVTGEAEPGAEVEIIIDGEVVDTVVADEDGQWEWESDAPLDDGEVTITASADSPSGEREDSITIEVDPTSTDVVIESPADGDVTHDSQPEVSGTAGPGATVTIFIDGEEQGTVTADSNGQWAWSPDEELEDGDYSIDVIAEHDGTISEDGVDVTIDASPDVVIESPSDDELTNDNQPEVSGTAAPGSSVTIYVDGEEQGTVTADSDGNWAWTPDEELDDGDHTIDVVADDDGTISEDSVDITVDTEPPSLVVDETDDGESVISGSTDAGATVDVYIDGEHVGTTTADADGNWSVPVADKDMEEGEEYDLTVVATDEAGNTTEVDLTLYFDDLGVFVGNMTGGGPACATTPGTGTGLAFLVGLFGLYILRRRRKKS